jgi:2,4-dienoyl-CoA reductase-like NADH-dependent reductase (Old Yellow Enzyme family)
MTTLFEPATLNGMTVRNRFVRSATWEAMATPAGEVTPKLVDTIAALARGGVGLIISSHAYVSPEGQAGPGQLGVHTDAMIPGLKQLTAAAHDHGAKMVLQLAHAGYLALESLTGRKPLAVSKDVRLDDAEREELTVAGIRRLVQAFANAAARAMAAGFDGVQFHSAHGYLFNQFLSPIYNRRVDDYGGPVVNRARVHVETVAAVRRVVGSRTPILVKINGRDFAEGGLEVEDSVDAAALMQQSGLDAVELSGGMAKFAKFGSARLAVTSEEKEAYHQPEARVYKQRLKIPLLLVGGFRSLNVAERLVAEGVCDFISMSRPFIREPDLIRRWQSGDRRPAACTSDNLCYGPARSGEGIYCVTAKKQQEKTAQTAEG